MHTAPIVLLTDFGLTDTFVGEMKGMILTTAPTSPIIDLCHAIAPQNIHQAAFMLDNATPSFPDSTIFICVIDPGVGTSRLPIIISHANQHFIAPDNGLLTPILQRDTTGTLTCHTITNHHLLPSRRSTTFHGRDLFAPAAALIATGTTPATLGPAIPPTQCQRITMPHCTTPDNGTTWHGTIIHTDHFGNIITSLDATRLDNNHDWQIHCGPTGPFPLVTTYGSVPDNHPLAYRGSAGRIELAIRNGNAARHCNISGTEPIIATATPITKH